MKSIESQCESKIRKAFRCTAPEDSISMAEAEALNYDISRYDDASVRRLLPLLLIKEMHALSKGAGTWSGDGLVYFLDGYLLGRKPTKDNLAKVTAYERSLAFQTKQFAGFNGEQALAILLWLNEVAYPNFKDHCPDDLESAIKFWKDKLKQIRG